MTPRDRIAHERQTLKPPPWGFTPSEVYKAGACPYPASTAGATAWAAALQMVAEILARDPRYFD
jgi:hypothetical protein